MGGRPGGTSLYTQSSLPHSPIVLQEKYDFDGTLMRRLMQQDEILAKKLQAEEEKLRDQEKLRDREAEANKASQNQGAKRGGSEQKASGEKAQAESFSQIVDEQFAVELGKKERVSG